MLLTAVVLNACQHTGDVTFPRRMNILVVHEMPTVEQTGEAVAKAFNEEFADTTRYRLRYLFGSYASYIRVNQHSYYSSQASRLNSRFNAEQQQGFIPDVVVLLDDLIAQAGADSDHPWMKQKPVVCLNIMYPEWEGRLAQHKNFVVMESKAEPKKNIDFIRALGRPSWIFTVIDSTWLDDKVRSSIIEQIGNDDNYIPNLNHETYPRLQGYTHRDSRSTLIPLNLEHAVFGKRDSTINADFEVTGALRIVNNHATFLRLKDDCYIDRSLNLNIDLYFSQTPRYFDLKRISALQTNVGGYFASNAQLAQQAHTVIDQLLSGADPSSFPVIELQKDYWLDWRVAKRIYPYAEDFPKYVRFVNLPWEKKSRFNEFVFDHWRKVLIAIIVIVAIVVPLVMTMRGRKQYRQLLHQGNKAQRDKKKIEDILSATRSYNWDYHPDGTIHISAAFSKAIGATRTVIPLEDLLRFIDKGRDQLREAIHDENVEHCMITVIANLPPKGERHAFIVHVNHISDEEGAIRCMGFSIFNDEEYETERIRKQAYQLSEEINVKESFLAAMSHEIRTPLNAIVGFADLLVKQYDMLTDKERAVYAQYINDSKDQLLNLLDDVMNYSERKGEKLSLELSRKSVLRLMNEVYYAHTVIVPKQIELKWAPGKDVNVKANRSAVLQIMSNFMNNAIKFTEQGSITLGWDIVTDDQGESVEMYVRDTGIGIAEENQQRIFEQFYKTNSHSVGAGIGLALCNQLAESMNGKIVLKSKLGEGSRFSLKLHIV